MIRRFALLITALVLLPVTLVTAQTTPPEVAAALADVSARTGLALTLADLDEWAWHEEIFSDASLGCPQPDMLYAQVVTHGLVITFRIDNTVYDYRAPSGSGQAIFCSATTLGEATIAPAVGGQWEYELVTGSFNPALDWSPSGMTLAVSGVVETSGAESGVVLLYNPDDLAAVPQAVPLAQPVTVLEFVEAPPITYLATGGAAGAGVTGEVALLSVEPYSLDIGIMDTAEGLPPARVNAIAAVDASAENEMRLRIAAVYAAQADPAQSDRWTILIWNAVTGTIVATPETGTPLTALDFSPDGTTLAAGGTDGTVILFSAESGEVISMISASSGADSGADSGAGSSVTDLEYSPDGSTLAVARGNGVNLWDVSGTPEQIAVTHTLALDNPILTIDFSPDGSLLALAGGQVGTASAPNTAPAPSAIRLWDVASDAVVATLTGHTSAVGAVAFSPDGARLASVGYDGTLRVWELGIAVG